MKTAVHIPDDIFSSAEKLARHLKLTRSQLYTRAVKDFIEIFNHETITDQLNTIYGNNENDSRIEPSLYKSQFKILEKEEW